MFAAQRVHLGETHSLQRKRVPSLQEVNCNLAIQVGRVVHKTTWHLLTCNCGRADDFVTATDDVACPKVLDLSLKMSL